MKLKVSKNKIKIKEKSILNDGEYKVNKCEFEFSKEYDGLVKKAVFFNDFDEPYKVTITNNTCDIPIEVLKKGKMTIGVYAYETNNDELVLRYSPSPDIIHVFDGSYVKDAQNSSTPTPTEIEQIEQQLQSKQDKLISSENIKTLNGNSILGQGDLSLAGAGDMEKRIYDTNDNGIVDNAEKVNNHTVECDVPANAVFTDTVFSGDYNDLSNKPSIPSKTSDLTNDSGYISSYTETDPTVPSHVKSISQGDIANWNNKSTFSGNYEDLTNKPTIPTVPTNVSSFTNDAGYLTSHQDISGKQDTLVSGTNIKTINNESILGSGDISISSGATYTAGTNIEITSENVINNIIPFEKDDNLKSFILGEKAQSFTHKTDNLAIGNSSIIENTQTILIGNESLSSKTRSVGITSTGALRGQYNIGIGFNINIIKDNSIAIGGMAYVNAKDAIALGYHASISEDNACQIGSNDAKINKIYIYTSNGNKQLATQDYVDTAIATAITSALGGSY